MPIVRSYFRRSPGAAAAEQSGGTRHMLDVAIYGSDGTTLLRDAAGTRHGASGLTFSSVLPGGFEQAAFTLPERVTRGWKGRPGLKVVIRSGQRIVWWGWIEDIVRPQQSAGTMQIMAYGPWQVLGQRHCWFAYTGTVYGPDAIGAMIRGYCSEISTDFSQLAATAVNIAPLTYDRKYVSELVRLVCDAGNSAGRRMLFELQAPTMRAVNGYPTSLLTNSNFETGTTMPTSWTYAIVTGDPARAWVTTPVHSPVRAVKFTRGSTAGTQKAYLVQAGITVSAGSSYTFDYSVYYGAVGSIRCWASVAWYKADDSYISTSETAHTSSGSAGWVRYIDTYTAPALAAKASIRTWTELPDSGAQAYAVWDDVYMYAPGTAVTIDTRPRARLWARDLTTADYLLYTREMPNGMDFLETTRDLVNQVSVQYGTHETTTYDATSKTLYRERDKTIDAGNVTGDVATALQTAYLARYKDPSTEPKAGISLSAPGAVRTTRGRVIDPVVLKAGDRLQVADGAQAGTILLLTRVAYSGGVVSCTPEMGDDVAAMLVR